MDEQSFLISDFLSITPQINVLIKNRGMIDFFVTLFIFYRIMLYKQNKRIVMKKSNRALYEIALEIKTDWTKPYFGAVPYLNAMLTLTDINSMYGLDDARSIVNYFLANANTWRGEKAREIKKELKEMLK